MQRIITDYLVLGAGIAGMFCALKLAEHGQVIVISKGNIPDGSTPLAQGGIASAFAPEDSPDLHYRDTLVAGAGHCRPEAVKILVHEGPALVAELDRLGVPFDRNDDGGFRLAREGAHSLPRVVSALGDGTGRAVAMTLAEKVNAHPRITTFTGTPAMDLLIQDDRCVGVLALVQRREITAFLARAVILATGGCGQVYKYTTCSSACTGDGLAMAYRAGARIVDMEFIQFHPTALATEENPMPLISEAVRGEGALLVNQRGERFMPRYHPWAELAPRDMVARAIFQELLEGKRVFLDASPIGNRFSRRFPSIYEMCLKRGIRPPEDLIPVVPAVHFQIGGVHTDTDGATTLPGLYACGEVACTGVHGANRLASNSLLEGLVFANRVARKLSSAPPDRPDRTTISLEIPELPARLIPDPPAMVVEELKQAMWEGAGLIREEEKLQKTLKKIKVLTQNTPREYFTAHNLLTAARLIVEAALSRQESRGSHYRRDYPVSNSRWDNRQIIFEKKIKPKREYAYEKARL